MTSQAKMATGMFLAFNGYVLAEMTDISEPPLAVEKVDSTSHDSPCKITIPGQLSYGDMTYTVNFVNDVTQVALETMATARTTGMWQVIFPPAFASLSYQVPGFVSGIKKKTPLKSNPAQRDFTVTPTGGITPITTAGPNLTAPYMIVEDQVPNIFTLSPALSGTTYQYTCTSKQASTAITVTPTAASGTIYVAGNQTATGVASTAIPYTLAQYPTGSILTVFVLVTGTNVTPSVYEIQIIRGTS